MENPYLNMYVGTPNEENWEDFLYLDLVIPGREVQLYCSKHSLNGGTGTDLLAYLEEAFNEAQLYNRYLGLKTHIEIEPILEILEESDESVQKNVKALLQGLDGVKI